jgi:hypothetical protein
MALGIDDDSACGDQNQEERPQYFGKEATPFKGEIVEIRCPRSLQSERLSQL